MRVFAGNKSLSSVCSPRPSLSLGGFASLKAPQFAPAGAPRLRSRNENGIQARSATRPESSPLHLRDDPQFAAACGIFLTEPGCGVIGSLTEHDCRLLGSLDAPCPQEHNGIATQNMLVYAIAWPDKQLLDQLADYQPTTGSSASIT